MSKSVNVAGTLWKGRRPLKVFLSESNYSKNFLFSHFSVLLAFGLFRACFFFSRLGLPHFHWSAAPKPCSTGAASFQSLLAGPTTRKTVCAPTFLRIARVWGAGLAPPIVAMSSQFSTSGKVTFSVGGTSAESAIQGDSSPPHPQNSH